MSVHYATVYKKDTGEIVQTGMFSCDEEMVELNFSARAQFYGEETHGVLRAPADSRTQYVSVSGDEVILLDKPPIPYQIDKTTIAADGTDFLTISGLHSPCEIVVDDPDPTVDTVVHTVEGGSFEFEADTPGLYFIEISRFPFLPTRLEITAL